MIAVLRRSKKEDSHWRHARFLEKLPLIRRQALLAFRNASPEAREDAIAEVIANAFCAFVRLSDRGKEDAAFATPLAMFAMRQYRAGRRVGTPLNSHDVLSSATSNNVPVVRLDRFDIQDGEWREVLIEDRRAGPAEIAAARIDVANWFRSLPSRMRSIAKLLAKGETTAAAAQRFQVTPGRISQLRRLFEQSWAAYQGQPAAA